MNPRDADPADDGADFVGAILACASSRAPQLSEADLQAIELEIRSQFGGRRIFVAKRRRQGVAVSRRLSEAEREALVQEAISTKSTNEELQSKYGVSRATLYRHFKR